jgi:hypothetical protein
MKYIILLAFIGLVIEARYQIEKMKNKPFSDENSEYDQSMKINQYVVFLKDYQSEEQKNMRQEKYNKGEVVTVRHISTGVVGPIQIEYLNAIDYSMIVDNAGYTIMRIIPIER